ncbi:MAG: hypothetical protein K9I47_07455 [Bacteroidales bacterium]|nr:hypothetical protein [Bacteroidales bacterium]
MRALAGQAGLPLPIRRACPCRLGGHSWPDVRGLGKDERQRGICAGRSAIHLVIFNIQCSRYAAKPIMTKENKRNSDDERHCYKPSHNRLSRFIQPFNHTTIHSFNYQSTNYQLTNHQSTNY